MQLTFDFTPVRLMDLTGLSGVPFVGFATFTIVVWALSVIDTGWNAAGPVAQTDAVADTANQAILKHRYDRL